MGANGSAYTLEPIQTFYDILDDIAIAFVCSKSEVEWSRVHRGGHCSAEFIEVQGSVDWLLCYLTYN